MRNQHTIAVIGGGKIGALANADNRVQEIRTHLAAYLAEPKLRVIGVAEPQANNRGVIKKYFPGVAIYESADKLFQEHRPEAVAIASPDETHRALFETSVKAGVRLIICEKPLATTVVDAEKMVALAKRKSVTLIVNHTRRFDPNFRVIASTIKSKIATIQSVRCNYVNGIRNNGTHIIDLLRWWLGDPIWVTAWPKKGLSATHREDINLDAVLEFSSGARAILQALEKNHYYSFTQEIYGTRGAYIINALGHDIRLARVAGGVFSDSPELELDPQRIGPSKKSFFESLAAHVVRCLEGEVKPYATGEDALSALKIIETLIKSAEAGGQKVLYKK